MFQKFACAIIQLTSLLKIVGNLFYKLNWKIFVNQIKYINKGRNKHILNNIKDLRMQINEDESNKSLKKLTKRQNVKYKIRN